jgi:hypothetical protein
VHHSRRLARIRLPNQSGTVAYLSKNQSSSNRSRISYKPPCRGVPATRSSSWDRSRTHPCFLFAGTPVAASTAFGAVVGPDELPVEFRIELMSGVVAQIQPRENMNVP